MDDTIIRVLLIEDNPGDARLIHEMLSESKRVSFQLRHAQQLSAGIEMLADNRIDVILLDLSLPDSRGINTLTRLQEHTSQIPIVVLTGWGDETLASKMVQAGVQDYLLKDQIHSEGLERTLWHAIERQRLWQRLKSRSLALRASEARFRKIITQNADGILIVDLEGKILYANPAAERLLRREAEDLVGHTINLPIVAGQTTEVTIKRSGQSDALIIETRAVQINWNEQACYLASLRDVTQRVQAETALKERNRQMASLRQIGLELVSELSLDRLLQSIVEQAVSFLSGHAGGFYLHRPEENLLELVVTSGANAPASGTNLHKGQHLAGRVWQENKSIITNSYHNQSDNSLIAIGVPVRSRGQFLGILEVLAQQPRQFSANDAELLNLFAAQAAVALQNAHYHEQLQHQNEELEKRVAARTRELTAANQRLQELDRLKSKFLSDVSHELRTPISISRLYLDLLRQGRSEDRDKYMQNLKESTVRLEALVEGILQISNLDKIGEQKQVTAVDLNQLLQEIARVNEERCTTLGLQLVLDLYADLPSVLGNAGQLKEMVEALLINAINYTPNGQITLKTALSEEGQIYLAVRDTGIGIPTAEVPHIFDRFYRGEGNSQIPGIGLGLSIAQTIAYLHHGTITCKSEVGQGSTFSVTLPQAT